MDKPENTAGRLQSLELTLNEAKDDVADIRSTQDLGGQTISGGGLTLPVAWDFPGGGADAFSAAWSVRVRAVEESGSTTYLREVFSPLWRTKDATHVAEGCAEGAWSALPGDVGTGSGGTLYAVLRVTVAAATYEQTGWELRLMSDVASLADTPIVPPDPDATGGGEGTDGVYHLIVPLGRFSGSAEDGGATGFEQWHVGVIAEDFFPRRSLVERTVVNAIGVADNKLQVYKEVVRTVLPGGKTPEMEEVPLPGGGGDGLPGGTLVAWDVVEKTYSGSGADAGHPDGSIWLRQRWRVWNTALKRFTESASYPDTDICRLDTLVGGGGGGWCVGAPEIVNEGGKLYEICYWWKVTAPTADGQPPTYAKTSFVAKRIELLAHGSDHTEGVL